MSEIMMGFVGDLVVNRDDPLGAFTEVRDALDFPDLIFGNLEGAYTDQPHPVPGSPYVIGSPARNLDAYAEVGFNVLSLANNHILDVGYDAMLETRRRLLDQGIKTCGAGAHLAEAREPAIVGIGGLSIAFLAYASVFPIGYEAAPNRPGLAPVRAYNHWREPFPSLYQPGTPPLITTVPDSTDLAHVTKDIHRAKERADLVIASFHWGDQMKEFHLTDHETRTARYCIDQGADMVVGHHHHSLRGMEWYNGKPIMYGLGNFVFDCRYSEDEARQILDSDLRRYLRQVGYPSDLQTLQTMPNAYHFTMMAWATAGRDGITDIGFLPCKLPPDGLVRPLPLDSSEGKEVVRYLEMCNQTQDLASRIVPDNSPAIAGLPTMRVVRA